MITELNLPSYRVEQAKPGRPADAGELASGPEPGKP
jgi:hypothetical protein